MVRARSVLDGRAGCVTVAGRPGGRSDPGEVEGGRHAPETQP